MLVVNEVAFASQVLENFFCIGFFLLNCLIEAFFCIFNLKIGRIKQKRGYKDQWPWNIKIYTDEMGNNKGDACVSYEDPSAAHSAGGFYNSNYCAPIVL